MTTSAPSRPVTHPARSSADELPWPSLLVLGTTTLVMVTTEMLPAAVLAPMSTGLGVAEAQIARLVSLWATVVVLTSFGFFFLAVVAALTETSLTWAIP